MEQAVRITDSPNDPDEDKIWAWALMSRFGPSFRYLRQKVMDAAVADLWAIKTGLAQ